MKERLKGRKKGTKERRKKERTEGRKEKRKKEKERKIKGAKGSAHNLVRARVHLKIGHFCLYHYGTVV